MSKQRPFNFVSIRFALVAGLVGLAASASHAPAQAAQDTSAAASAKTFKDGKWVLSDGTPTYDVKDGSVDWSTFSGYRRYSSECHVCHGPDGEGSSYAPALSNSLKTMDYATFLQVVASGKSDNSGGTQFVMPALGDNKNVMCYVNDIYVYLKARADGAVGRGRPEKHADKPKEATAAENSCMGP
jgi:methanol metabolism-related c-type cytochrome